jgi:hypothetical protein
MDHHSPKYTPIIYHLRDPPHFSLVPTFNLYYSQEKWYWLAYCLRLNHLQDSVCFDALLSVSFQFVLNVALAPSWA